MNITIILQELETLETNEHEQSNVRYYVEEPKSPTIVDANKQTKMIYDIIADVDGPIIKMQQVHHHVVAAQEPISFASLLSLPHLLTRKTRGKEPLVDYNQSYVVTSSEYFSILQQKVLAKEVAKVIKQQKKKEKEDKRAQ